MRYLPVCSPPIRAMKQKTSLVAAMAASALLCTTVSAAFAPPAHAAAPGKRPLVVVLCKFTDQTAEPRNAAYYRDMFSESGAGRRGAFDFWKDVSYGSVDLTGTVVTGWYTAGLTAAEFNVADRNRQIDVCASKADPDVDFNAFAGVVVLTNHTNFQGPLFGHAAPTTIAGTTYANLGAMAAEEDQELSGILHETAHTLGLKHSRTVSQAPNQADYGDSYDLMSCMGCHMTATHSYQGLGGPGLNAVQLDTAGLLPAGRALTMNTSGCTQQSVQMAALNRPEATGPLQVRIPAAVPIVKQFTSTTSDHYSIELRSRSGWDGGIPRDTFLVHLKGQDTYSYWVDSAGALTAGREFVDAARGVYVAVNSITASPASTGVITVGSCKIGTRPEYTGPANAAYHDVVTLTADLTVDPSGAPIPGAPVRLSLGSQSCSANTDGSGHASCALRIDQAPGTYAVQAAFAGTAAYTARTSAKTFTVSKQSTAMRYGGPTTLTNGSAATLRATLVEAGGEPIGNRSVSFAVGTGASAQACTGTTNAAGLAECTIPRVLQVGGASAVRVAFAGDTSYLPSSASPAVTVAKGQTALRYEGPANIANDFAATFRATLTQQDGAVPLAGRAVRFTLGTGTSAQTCTGTTNAAGRAECAIATVAQPAAATTAGVRVEFAGDTFFLASAGSATAKLLYYTGRSYALSTRLALLPPAVVSDTGNVTTASRSTTEKTTVSVSTPVVSATSLNAGVTTGGAKSTGQAGAQNVTIGIAGLPVIRVGAVRAFSESVCGLAGPSASTSAGVTIESLTIGGVVHNTATVAPNTVIRVGTATITLNEQSPVPQASAGLLVNAVHVFVPGVADVVVAAAQSAVLNCP